MDDTLTTDEQGTTDVQSITDVQQKTDVQQTVLSGQVSDDQIAAWKKQFPGGVWELIVDGKVGYFRRPNRNELKSVATMGKSDPLGMVETLMNDSWLGGDDAIIKDDAYYMTAITSYEELIGDQTATLKKL